jgi:pyruvate dehydrogenase (quinone)
MNGDPKFEASQDIPSVPYHRFAELIGLRGFYVDDAERMAAVWDDALASDRPVVIEVKADPNIAPLPPHITLQQAKAFATTLFEGDPNERSIIVDTAKQVLGAVLPGHRDE